jgi:hypothetical protein
MISSLLPDSVRIYTSAGAGFDWVDTRRLARKGIILTAAVWLGYPFHLAHSQSFFLHQLL